MLLGSALQNGIRLFTLSRQVVVVLMQRMFRLNSGTPEMSFVVIFIQI